ncbi:hypothetical protein IE81DRAFT_364332 [Ceraceosorus guamensis]|uniref:Uncharacterized protein n=1 Tax=Ceraceosorus guamensis TaxID=1522189 RepID=A0A316W986_9BASI|nr:hypothetical protein IE81DRAFT_364332 [Ceraceosorus guamensis]PWN45321.1 hypothetical protein IE81DRAFT_364332 [Ceraceosorus guamensis]
MQQMPGGFPGTGRPSMDNLSARPLPPTPPSCFISGAPIVTPRQSSLRLTSIEEDRDEAVRSQADLSSSSWRAHAQSQRSTATETKALPSIPWAPPPEWMQEAESAGSHASNYVQARSKFSASPDSTARGKLLRRFARTRKASAASHKRAPRTGKANDDVVALTPHAALQTKFPMLRPTTPLDDASNARGSRLTSTFTGIRTKLSRAPLALFTQNGELCAREDGQFDLLQAKGNRPELSDDGHAQTSSLRWPFGRSKFGQDLETIASVPTRSGMLWPQDKRASASSQDRVSVTTSKNSSRSRKVSTRSRKSSTQRLRVPSSASRKLGASSARSPARGRSAPRRLRLLSTTRVAQRNAAQRFDARGSVRRSIRDSWIDVADFQPPLDRHAEMWKLRSTSAWTNDKAAIVKPSWWSMIRRGKDLGTISKDGPSIDEPVALTGETIDVASSIPYLRRSDDILRRSSLFDDLPHLTGRGSHSVDLLRPYQPIRTELPFKPAPRMRPALPDLQLWATMSHTRPTVEQAVEPQGTRDRGDQSRNSKRKSEDRPWLRPLRLPQSAGLSPTTSPKSSALSQAVSTPLIVTPPLSSGRSTNAENFFASSSLPIPPRSHRSRASTVSSYDDRDRSLTVALAPVGGTNDTMVSVQTVSSSILFADAALRSLPSHQHENAEQAANAEFGSTKRPWPCLRIPPKEPLPAPPVSAAESTFTIRPAPASSSTSNTTAASRRTSITRTSQQATSDYVTNRPLSEPCARRERLLSATPRRASVPTPGRDTRRRAGEATLDLVALCEDFLDSPALKTPLRRRASCKVQSRITPENWGLARRAGRCDSAITVLTYESTVYSASLAGTEAEDEQRLIEDLMASSDEEVEDGNRRQSVISSLGAQSDDEEPYQAHPQGRRYKSVKRVFGLSVAAEISDAHILLSAPPEDVLQPDDPRQRADSTISIASSLDSIADEAHAGRAMTDSPCPPSRCHGVNRGDWISQSSSLQEECKKSKASGGRKGASVTDDSSMQGVSRGTKPWEKPSENEDGRELAKAGPRSELSCFPSCTNAVQDRGEVADDSTSAMNGNLLASPMFSTSVSSLNSTPSSFSVSASPLWSLRRMSSTSTGLTDLTETFEGDLTIDTAPSIHDVFQSSPPCKTTSEGPTRPPTSCTLRPDADDCPGAAPTPFEKARQWLSALSSDWHTSCHAIVEEVARSKLAWACTPFSNSLLASFKPPTDTHGLGVFLIESQARFRPLAEQKIVTVGDMHSNSILDTPKRWRHLSPVAEQHLREQLNSPSSSLFACQPDDQAATPAVTCSRSCDPFGSEPRYRSVSTSKSPRSPPSIVLHSPSSASATTESCLSRSSSLASSLIQTRRHSLRPPSTY